MPRGSRRNFASDFARSLDAEESGSRQPKGDMLKGWYWWPCAARSSTCRNSGRLDHRTVPKAQAEGGLASHPPSASPWTAPTCRFSVDHEMTSVNSACVCLRSGLVVSHSVKLARVPGLAGQAHLPRPAATYLMASPSSRLARSSCFLLSIRALFRALFLASNSTPSSSPSACVL